MKRIIIAASLLLLSAALSIYSSAVFSKVTNEMIDDLYILVDLSQKNDLGALSEETDKILLHWNKAARTLNMLTVHSGISTAQTLVNSLADLLESGETHEFRKACIACIAELKSIKNSEKISVENIL